MSGIAETPLAPRAESLARLTENGRARALEIERICQEIDRAVHDGATQTEAVRRIVAEHQANGGKVSRTAAHRWFARWNDQGKAIDALLPGRHGRPAAIPEDLFLEYQRRATLPGMVNLSVVINDLKREWRAGKPIPGLGTWREWWSNNRPDYPPPATVPDFPISDRAFYRAQPARAVRTIGVHGFAAAKKLLPWLTRDSGDLRPGEVYLFDDVRLDLIAIDDATGRPTELKMYVAYEVGSRFIVAFILRPANGMKKEDVDLLVARTLQRVGIGRDYVTHLVFEQGTLTMNEEMAQTLERITAGRIKVHWTSMIPGRRYAGAHADRPVGSWMGKAVLESFMRKIHLALMTLPGQRGNSYANQPANLGWTGQGAVATPGSLTREAGMLGEIEHLAGHRLRLNCGLMWASTVALAVHNAMNEHNNERGHSYQGFGELTQVEVAPGVWEEAPSCC